MTPWWETVLIIAVTAIVVIIVYLAIPDAMPDAMHSETLNQRQIASKVIGHLPGYAEYKQFTEANHE